MYVPSLTQAGYTVFTVTHRAIPTFRFPAPVEDVQRAVRFIRHNAAKYAGAADLNAKYQARVGRPADVLTGPSYALVQIVADALRRAGKTDGESLRTALAQTDLPTTMIGAVKFNADGTGVVETLLPQWQNGKSELIWPREQASAPPRYPAPPFSQR